MEVASYNKTTNQHDKCLGTPIESGRPEAAP